MADELYVQRLEAVLAQMLQPVRGVPFPVVVRALSRKDVLPIDVGRQEDGELLRQLEQAIELCARELKAKPIERPRPNEVGNDIEPFVMKAINAVGLQCMRPAGSSGAGKAAGYPDLVLSDRTGRTIYLECKIMAASSKDTSFRSFYLSPSDSFKVTKDAVHLLLSFEMVRAAGSQPGMSQFLPAGFRLVDLAKLECDVKYEFNSDNRRLYASHAILLAGEC